jgi:serine protease
MVGKWVLALGLCGCVTSGWAAARATSEWNPVHAQPVAVGPEASRLVVGFRTTQANAVVRIMHSRTGISVAKSQAQTTSNDVLSLARRVQLPMARSRQLTPSMHVVYLQKTLYGADVNALLGALRADPAVQFAEIDMRRYPNSPPNDPLFVPTSGAAGQWYMMTPNPTGDASATDAVSAWGITTGSAGVVIADIDTGVRFDHPDLLRAGFGGRLLPGYDFVSEDQNSSTGAPLGTYLIANDGDGWDPDPSDPGDWIDSADQTNALFPASSCPIADSTWHGTRVMGILGAVTNNDVGIAGMTWNSYLLPVRALGKCGGYDSDIIAAMQWAAGLSVSGVPDNPYPASIINLSLGGGGACPSDYADVVNTLTAMGVLIVASAGNASGPVDAPGNCTGVLGVAGLRNVGTKVGYSSFGAEVGVAAPAGNCVNASGACLKSIDTTSNTGLTVPSSSTYTNETNVNLGTSFSAPIVSGIAALMRTVNANLTPAQLIARIKASAVTFPQPAGVPVCSTAANNGSLECACPTDGSECGAGMVNALTAVTAAERPIAAVAVSTSGAGTVLDASGSSASCGRTVAAYTWTATGGIMVTSGAPPSSATITASGTAGNVTLTVTDSAGASDTAVLAVSASGAVTQAATTPTAAGTGITSCASTTPFAPVPPTVTAAFSPSSVGENAVASLTITVRNANGFALTQAGLTQTLPANLIVPAGVTGAMTSCSGTGSALTASGGTVTLTGAIIPANGSCAIMVPVQSATAGSYTTMVAANALSTAPAGANSDPASATLTVTAPSGGGGKLDVWDTLFVVGVLLAGRRHAKTRRRP